MTPNLSSALAKLGRAHEHAQAIKDEIRAWRDSSRVHGFMGGKMESLPPASQGRAATA